MSNLRVIGLLFMGLSLFVLWGDAKRTVLLGQDLRMRPAGEIWRTMANDSFAALRSFVQGWSDGLWDGVFVPVFETPLAPMIFVIGVIVYVLGSGPFRLR